MKMNMKQKCCSLIFDEMSLSCQLQYNKKEDVIEGIDNSTSNPGIVDHATVFIIQDIFSKWWKQPVYFTFSDGPIKSVSLKATIEQVIEKCQEIGLNVKATVCDQGGSNFKRLGEENRLFEFIINGREIIPLYDVPRLFKGLRINNY